MNAIFPAAAATEEATTGVQTPPGIHRQTAAPSCDGRRGIFPGTELPPGTAKRDARSPDICGSEGPASAKGEVTKGTAGIEMKGRPRALNATCFLNRAVVRDFLLERARRTRAHKFTRVSNETLVKLNEILRAAMLGHVARFPSKGKTI